MRIAVDAMGGDTGPSVAIQGAVEGARTFGVEVSLVGRLAEIEPLLRSLHASGLAVDIIDAPDVIEMDEHPVQAVRRKPKSSISVALGLVKDGVAQAMVSAGNSGAVMAASLAVLGRIPGIDRPAIAGFMPTLRGAVLVLDLGAVTDPKPHHLVQFAHMGRIYAEFVLGVASPTVGLLSNGEEPSKGNQLVQEVHPLLEHDSDINFAGNIEGKDLLRGTVDVIVTDGFTGNVALKVAEGTATLLMDVLREEMTRTLPRKLAALTLRSAFQAAKKRLDYSEFGGAPLLGVNGAVIIAHGRSNAHAIANAVGAAHRVAAGGVPEAIRRSASATGQRDHLDGQVGRESV